MDSAEEKELILKAKERDKDAFEKLFVAYRVLVRDRVFNLLPPHLKQDTDDVHQESFVKAWAALPNFQIGRPGGFSKWLTTIATSTAMDRIRREPKPPVELDDNNDMLLTRGLTSLLDEEEVGPLHERVGVALGKMEYDCRIFLLAGFVYGIAPVEIARIARSTLSPEGRQTPMASRVQEWFQNLIGPLEKQSTVRRNYCLSELKRRLEKGSSRIFKKGTKRESRGGTIEPSRK